MTKKNKNQSADIPVAESQNIEYKSSWRDECLKWICGFANANGGKLLIGVDDKGRIVGVDNQKRLMEEIPNKAIQHLVLPIEILPSCFSRPDTLKFGAGELQKY